MNNYKFVFFVFTNVLFFWACTKEGTGGKASINGHVKHHEASIPNAAVYIKYGAKEFPGITTANYDDSTLSSSSDAHYEFINLQKGDYYLYAFGFDTAINAYVKGGLPIKIKKSQVLETDVPVTED